MLLMTEDNSVYVIYALPPPRPPTFFSHSLFWTFILLSHGPAICLIAHKAAGGDE